MNLKFGISILVVILERSAKTFCDFVNWVKFYGQKGFSKVET